MNETTAVQTTETKTANRLNRSTDRRQRELRNLIKRGNRWYFKKMVDGKVRPVSLNTEDEGLARQKRDEMEAKALKGEFDKIQGPRTQNGTLADVFEVYERFAAITRRAVGNNISSLMTIVRGALKDPNLEPDGVKLTVLTPKLLRDYQDVVRKAYADKAGTNEDERRAAREKADRTTKSTFNQAKSIFATHGKTTQWIQRYTEEGIVIPECVKEFAKAGAVGKLTRSVYFPPTDEDIAKTFKAVEDLRAADPEAYNLFWTALATGARRNELADLEVEHLEFINGRRWITTGYTKNGDPLRIPLIAWQVHLANPRTPASVVEEMIAERKTGFMFLGSRFERYDAMPDRLNGWLKRMGWDDEKKLHNIRAYIGCQIYKKNPKLAQLYLRHDTLQTTEDYYGQFLKLEEVCNMDMTGMGPAAPSPAPQLTIVQTNGQAVAA